MKMTVSRCTILSLISISLYSLFFIYQSHHNASYYVGNLYRPFRFLSQENSKDISQKRPEDIHPLSYDEPYLSRILHIKKMCSKENLTTKFELKNKRSFKYEDNSQLVMCEVPKVASTTWQILLLRLGGFKENFTETLRKKWGYSMIPNTNFQSVKNETKIWRLMKNYTTFLLTRHPFERLVSAYYDKFSNRSRFEFYKKKFGIPIAQQQAPDYLHGVNIISPVSRMTEQMLQYSSIYKALGVEKQKEVRNYLKVLQTGEIYFLQFVKFIIKCFRKDQVGNLDVHWRPQVLLCHPCQFNYSCVIKFENVVSESNRLLDYVQTKNVKIPLSERHYFPQQSKPATENLLTEKTMKQIPEKFVETLREIYEVDFTFYNYDPYLYNGY